MSNRISISVLDSWRMAIQFIKIQNKLDFSQSLVEVVNCFFFDEIIQYDQIFDFEKNHLFD